jgi:hypothetical protein
MAPVESNWTETPFRFSTAEREAAVKPARFGTAGTRAARRDCHQVIFKSSKNTHITYKQNRGERVSSHLKCLNAEVNEGTLLVPGTGHVQIGLCVPRLLQGSVLMNNGYKY